MVIRPIGTFTCKRINKINRICIPFPPSVVVVSRCVVVVILFVVCLVGGGFVVVSTLPDVSRSCITLRRGYGRLDDLHTFLKSSRSRDHTMAPPNPLPCNQRTWNIDNDPFNFIIPKKYQRCTSNSLNLCL